MEIKVAENLESSGYRRLFECVKQEGIEPVINIIKDINEFNLSKDEMLKRAVVYGKNDLLALVRRNMEIIKYLREHNQDFKSFSFTSKLVLNTLTSLQENISCLELYLENARRLENLKIFHIGYENFDSCEWYKCNIYRNNAGEIINISKSYTDGKIEELFDEQLKDKMFNNSVILYKVDNSNTSFCLRVENNENGYQCRTIKIKDFGFDASKLPTEEEIRSYDIPKQLIRK